MAHWSTQPEESSSIFRTSGVLELHHPWNCFCQAGDNGSVFTHKEPFVYHTAFFEAFPREPLSTFIRGEGKDIVEAEERAWEEWQRALICKEHIWERRGYRNGAGFCKNCGAFKPQAFEPLEKCVICGEATYYHSTENDKWYCEKCIREMPLSEWSEIDWSMAYDENEMWNWEHGLK